MGYSVLVERREEELAAKDGGEEKPQQFENGPMIIIRNPLSTDQDPHQDIPIMIFTYAQWKLVQDDNLIVSAASFGPGELSRNAQYVFALPPRYNYGFETGWEDVNSILQHNPFAFILRGHR